MTLKELLLRLKRRADLFALVNVPLTTVDNGHVTQTQRDDPPRQDIHHVRPLVHQIDLGEHAHSPRTIRVDLSRQLQAIRVCQVRIGRSDSKNDTCWFRNVLDQHFLNLPFDVARLVTDGHSRDTRQIDKRKRQHIR